MIAEKANVGSGDKGRGYGEGFIATPVATYFAARERIMFTIQIPEFIQAFEIRARYERSEVERGVHGENHEKNHVQLPTLPPDYKYWYDAKDGELKVLRPN